MLVTRQFIYLTFPRTGCNFCRTVIKELYNKRKNENKLFQFYKYGSVNNSCEEILTHHYFEDKENHHSSYSQIPKKFKKKIIVSNIRNPISRFESMYKLKWWNSVNAFNDADFKNIYNHYPNISIEDYTDLLDKSFQQHLNKIGFNKNIKIGPQTLEFINFFFKNPTEVLKNLSLSYIENKEYLKDIGNVHFLQQENLKEDLARFLKAKGFNKNEIEFIEQHDSVNVSKKHTDSLSSEIKENIKETEWLLFEILRELGFSYN